MNARARRRYRLALLALFALIIAGVIVANRSEPVGEFMSRLDPSSLTAQVPLPALEQEKAKTMVGFIKTRIDTALTAIDAAGEGESDFYTKLEEVKVLVKSLEDFVTRNKGPYGQIVEFKNRLDAVQKGMEAAAALAESFSPEKDTEFSKDLRRRAKAEVEFLQNAIKENDEKKMIVLVQQSAENKTEAAKAFEKDKRTADPNPDINKKYQANNAVYLNIEIVDQLVQLIAAAKKGVVVGYCCDAADKFTCSELRTPEDCKAAKAPFIPVPFGTANEKLRRKCEFDSCRAPGHCCYVSDDIEHTCTERAENVDSLTCFVDYSIGDFTANFFGGDKATCDAATKFECAPLGFCCRGADANKCEVLMPEEDCKTAKDLTIASVMNAVNNEKRIADIRQFKNAAEKTVTEITFKNVVDPKNDPYKKIIDSAAKDKATPQEKAKNTQLIFLELTDPILQEILAVLLPGSTGRWYPVDTLDTNPQQAAKDACKDKCQGVEKPDDMVPCCNPQLAQCLPKRRSECVLDAGVYDYEKYGLLRDKNQATNAELSALESCQNHCGKDWYCVSHFQGPQLAPACVNGPIRAAFPPTAQICAELENNTAVKPDKKNLPNGTKLLTVFPDFCYKDNDQNEWASVLENAGLLKVALAHARGEKIDDKAKINLHFTSQAECAAYCFPPQQPPPVGGDDPDDPGEGPAAGTLGGLPGGGGFPGFPGGGGTFSTTAPGVGDLGGNPVGLPPANGRTPPAATPPAGSPPGSTPGRPPRIGSDGRDGDDDRSPSSRRPVADPVRAASSDRADPLRASSAARASSLPGISSGRASSLRASSVRSGSSRSASFGRSGSGGVSSSRVSSGASSGRASSGASASASSRASASASASSRASASASSRASNLSSRAASDRSRSADRSASSRAISESSRSRVASSRSSARPPGDPCADRGQCANRLCVQGTCRTCNSDAQCPTGERCFSGSCRRPPGSGCASNEECSSSLCLNARCVPDEDLPRPVRRPTREIPASCGNGSVDNPLEQCDDGPRNSDFDPDACRADCTLPRCGDGIVDTNEQCDDRNGLSGDGCNRFCQYEAGAGPAPGLPPGQGVPGQPGSPLEGSLTPIATGRPPAGNTGPAAVAVMAAGAAWGWAWMRKRRRS